MAKNIEKKLKLTFCSGVDTVTGANFLLEDEEANTKVLIDCGLIQGETSAEEDNKKNFSYDPASVEALFITHAHLDHIGRIPRLIAAGFKGKIYSTPPTKDLAKFMIEDAAHILAHGQNAKEIEKIYSEENINKMMSMWETFPYHHSFVIKNFLINFKNSGHILGSALIEITYNAKKIVFTGDLGNSPSPILPDCEEITDATYLIMESVYGDRNHESREDRRAMLEDVIEDNCKRRGTLMIPTFSLERTQELLFEIDALIEKGRIPLVPFFLDSPLAIKLTEVYRKYEEYFNEEALKMAKSGKDIFVFPGLRQTPAAEQSKMILKMPNPKIIIAGSGMSSGGRIIHHERNYLPDANNTILLTGYQSAGTLGRYIEEGARSIKIAGEEVPVKARVAIISGYSGHKDSEALLKFVEAMEDRVKQIFTVMGEPKSSLFLVQKIRDNLGLLATAPNKGQSIWLEF
jgi:metallo-beta-lactamase family protein